MTLQVLPASFGKGGTSLTDGTLYNAVRELQGLQVTVVPGAANGTAMAVPALRLEDTLLAALITTDAGGAAANDVANLTIQATAAFGTITISGNPADAEVFVVNGKTYTFKTTPTDIAHVKITAGDNTAMATAVKNAINAYEGRYVEGKGYNTPAVVATSSAGVVTVTSVVDGAGNAVTVTGTATVLVAAGSGTLSATLTPVTVVPGNTCVINGVTFTAATVPDTTGLQFYTKASAPAFPNGGAAGTDLSCGQWLSYIINAKLANSNTDAVASANATTGVVTITPKTAPAGNMITLTETAANVAVTGTGTLTGGTNTGGVKSVTNLTGKTMTLFWFNKK
jgi:hypothetical protein